MPITDDLRNRLHIALGSANAGEEIAAILANWTGQQSLDVPGSFTVDGTVIVESSTGAVAAAGSSQGTAAALAYANNVVSGADATKGAVLPVPTRVGQMVGVLNTNGSSVLKVYPDSGGSINAGTANASVNLAASKGTTYLCTAVGPSAWWSMAN